MKAAQLDRPGKGLRLVELPEPEPKTGEVLVRVRACGVCRTDLHIVDGEITGGSYPIVPGHQIVGEVVQAKSAGLPLDSGLESPGWDIRAVFATSAAAVRKIFVTPRSLPAINARADMRNTWPRMPGFAFPYPLNIPTCRLHPCCARG